VMAIEDNFNIEYSKYIGVSSGSYYYTSGSASHGLNRMTLTTRITSSDGSSHMNCLININTYSLSGNPPWNHKWTSCNADTSNDFTFLYGSEDERDGAHLGQKDDQTQIKVWRFYMKKTICPGCIIYGDLDWT
jgi:hypothetical protein